MNKQLLIWLVISFAFATHSQAESYKYTDDNGSIVFMDDLNKIPENQRSKAQKLEEKAAPHTPTEENLPDRNNSNRQAYPQALEKLKSCPIETREEKERAIKSTWDKMVSAMVPGNREKAFSYFSMERRDEHRRALADANMNQLAELLKNLPIHIMSLEEFGAEVEVLREENGTTFSYPAEFIKDFDCEWRINRL